METPIFTVPLQVSPNTTVLVMNDAFRDLLINFIDDVHNVEPQIVAMARSIQDPATAHLKMARRLEGKHQSRRQFSGPPRDSMDSERERSPH